MLDPDAGPDCPRSWPAAWPSCRDGGARGSGPVRFATPTDGLRGGAARPRQPLGTLLVGRPEGRPHSPEDVVLIEDIARRAALAIHNAQSTAAHVEVSQALQQALLPRALPAVPASTSPRSTCRPATGSDVGGDFYDVVAVDPTRWLVSIGDVCGKGARAAARTGLVRDVLRVLVREGRPLPEAIDTLNDVMMEAADPLQFCTLAAATVRRAQPPEPPGLLVDLVLAGHLQPVLVRADGHRRAGRRVRHRGRAGPGRPGGHAPGTGSQPGDTLLLYTDGVTERRRGREQFGPDRLLEVAAKAAGPTAAQLVAAVREAVERFSAAPLDDDVALLAVRASRLSRGRTGIARRVLPANRD